MEWIGIPQTPGGYGTILVDPPWPYGQKLTGERVRGGAEKHYDTITIEEISSLPVRSLVGRNAIVWLWTTNTHHHAAFHVLESWGAAYKTQATWPKKRFGLGYWLRGKTEHLLLATYGNPREMLNGPHGATGSWWSTLLEGPAEDDALLTFGLWRGHSRKPESSYEMIEAMSPAPRLELFARRKRAGWTVWGEGVPDSGPIETAFGASP